MGKILNDNKRPNMPVNYNHYHTDNIQKVEVERLQTEMTALWKNTGVVDLPTLKSMVEKGVHAINANMEEVGCEDALIQVMSIYKACTNFGWQCSHVFLEILLTRYFKVLMKVFIANITVQVVERHLMTGLADVLSADWIMKLSDDEVMKIAGGRVWRLRIGDARSRVASRSWRKGLRSSRS